jgi:hypothetical protein
MGGCKKKLPQHPDQCAASGIKIKISKMMMAY